MKEVSKNFDSMDKWSWNSSSKKNRLLLKSRDSSIFSQPDILFNIHDLSQWLELAVRATNAITYHIHAIPIIILMSKLLISMLSLQRLDGNKCSKHVFVCTFVHNMF